MKEPRKRIVPLFIPFLGCRSQCVFCDQRMLTGTGNAAPTAEDIRTILEKALALQPAGQKVEAAFYGGSFTALPLRQQEELLAPAQHFLATGQLTGIRLSTRPDAIDEEEARWLKTQGVSCVELGAQSLCNSVLKAAKRGYDFSCIEKAVAVLRHAGLALEFEVRPPGHHPAVPPGRGVAQAEACEVQRRTGQNVGLLRERHPLRSGLDRQRLIEDQVLRLVRGRSAQPVKPFPQKRSIVPRFFEVYIVARPRHHRRACAGHLRADRRGQCTVFGVIFSRDQQCRHGRLVDVA